MARKRETVPIAWATLAGTLVPIAAAQGAEHLLSMLPCAFCLLERWPWYAAAIGAWLALLLPRHPARLALWATIGVIGLAAAASAIHVGVERHWWPDPLPECRTPDFRGMSMAERLAAMPARPAKPCEDPDYLIPGVPVSMAEMGVLYALALAAALAIWMGSTRGKRFR